MENNGISPKSNYVVDCLCCMQGGSEGKWPVSLPAYRLDDCGRIMTKAALLGHLSVYHSGECIPADLFSIREYNGDTVLSLNVFEYFGIEL